MANSRAAWGKLQNESAYIVIRKAKKYSKDDGNMQKEYKSQLNRLQLAKSKEFEYENKKVTEYNSLNKTGNKLTDWKCDEELSTSRVSKHFLKNMY